MIETLIYAVIVAGVISFAVFSVWQFMDSGNRVRNQKELVENQRVLEQKIYWLLQSVSAINSPAAGDAGGVLSVNKIGFAENPAVIDVESGVARLRRGTNPPLPITDGSYVSVQNLSFQHLVFSGQPAIKVIGALFNDYTSTSVNIDTTILIR